LRYIFGVYSHLTSGDEALHYHLLRFTLLMKLISIILFCIGFSCNTFGQLDTEFWFAPPEVTSGHVTDNPIVLRMATGSTAATVTIEQPANVALFNGGAPIVVVIPANSAATIDLSADLNNLETRPSDMILTTGLHISSTTKITCYYDINTGFNPEIFALKGRNALGMEFYTPFQNIWRNGSYTPTPYTSFDIVATEDNTTIFIFPRVPLDGGHPALTSYSITLMRGETYSGSVTSTLGSANPAGTAITSDKPIAVSIKDDSVWPQPAGCRDLIGDQIVPVDKIGTDYILNLGGLTVPERGYLLATENATDVFVAGVYQTTLFAGETYGFDLTAATTYVNCTNPVYCLHISGFGCEIGGALLPSLYCSGSTEVNFVRSTTEFFGLNILVKAGSEGDFLLNGNPALMPMAAFAVVPGTGGLWMSAQISYNTTDVPIGTNNLITNSTGSFNVGLINGGASSGCRFGYLSQFISEIITAAGIDQIVCSNDTVQLTGSVTGGSTSGQWSSTGSGIFLPDNLTLNAEYVPSFTDLATGFVNLTLASTGACDEINDSLTLTFTPVPIANAGTDQTACGNNSAVTLSGVITIASGGIWTGGSGTFTPNNTTLSAYYVPSAAEVTAGIVNLTLTTTGNGTCNPESDVVTINFTSPPTSAAGANQSVCSNNADVTLGGSITIATGGIWTGGLGTFTPNNATLNAVYTPTGTEIAAGTLTLSLTTSGNGTCSAVTDNMVITFTTSPTANASINQTVCANNSDIALSGTVTTATGGLWTGGLGFFAPNSATLNAVYTPTLAEILSGSLTFTLTTTGNGNCNALSDDMDVTFTAAPTADAGVDQIVCADSSYILLNGNVTIASGGTWSGGAGTFSPNNSALSATYTPTAAEIAGGTLTLTLTTFGNGSCNGESDVVTVTFTPAPTLNAGVDQLACSNSSTVTLAGIVSVATGGVWTGGLGTFTPNNATLNGNYSATAAEIGAGAVTLTLTSSGNGTCNAVTDNMVISYAPTSLSVDAQLACESYLWIDGNTYTSSTNTPTFTFVAGGVNGCDSIVTLDLTINNSTNGTDVQSECASYLWIDGNTYTTSTNTPTFTYSGGASNGCDSIVTLDLTIDGSASGTDVQMACESYVWIDGNTYASNNITATHIMVGGAANGCDSIVTLDLTINNSATGTDLQGACGSYTWIDGNTYASSTNTPTFTIVNGAFNGCDSIVTLDLTINNSVSGTDVQIACGSYTWLDGNTYSGSTSTPTYTYVGGGFNGCDSIVTLNLTINNGTTGIDVQTACATFVWIDGNSYNSGNATAMHTIVGGAANGCDSTVTLNLTFSSGSTGTDVQTACDSYIWIDGNTYASNNSTAAHTIIGGAANGCDSIVSLNLTIFNSSNGTDVQSACNSFTWIDGNIYTSSNNTATHTITNGGSNGCDSIVTLDLSLSTVNSDVVDLGYQLIASANGAIYQWIYCDSIAIVGETNQSFTPSGNEDYALVITENGCTDTSECYTFLTVGLFHNSFGADFKVYPNPTSGMLRIDLGHNYSDIRFNLMNGIGELIFTEKINSSNQIDLNIEGNSGMYFLEIKTREGEKAYFKIMKE
jgi:hypothetical protein